MTLAQELQEAESSRREKRDPTLTAKMDAGVEEVAKSGLVEAGLKVGDQAPNFALPNVKGETTNLTDLLSQGPIVLSFYRGAWCPYCNIALRHLQQSLPDIQKHGAQLITISPQTPDGSLNTAEKNQLEFEVLSDVGSKVARDYNLIFELPESLHGMYGNPDGINLLATNASDKFELPLAATYVIKQDGSIAYVFADADYTKRAEPSDILAALKNL